MTIPTKLINSLSTEFHLDEPSITSLYSSIYVKWQEYTSVQEFLSLVTFGYDNLKNWETLSNYLNIICDTLNDESKLRHLNLLGVTGLLDLDKINTDTKKNIVAEVFGSVDILNFLFALSQDQMDEKSSLFIRALDYLAKFPVE